MRAFLSILISLVLAQSAWAQRGVSAPDPYALHGVAGMVNISTLPFPYEYNYNGRTQKLISQIRSGCSTIGVGVFIGTSTSDNYVNATYSPANPNSIFNFSIDNGGFYLSQEPLLGGYLNTQIQPTVPSANGNFVHVLSDKIVSAGLYSCFINVPLGVNAALFSDWASGGAINDRITVAFRRLAAQGLTPNFVAIQIGENDNTAGTSQASCTASLNSIISTIRASFAGTILVSTTSWHAGTTATNVTNAQAAVINNGAGIYAGANTDAFGNGDRWDTTHPNATGALDWSNAWVTKITAAPH